MAKSDPSRTIEAWLEWDLSTAARKGELKPAFEVEGIFDRLTELLLAGVHPILVGESGVGKTALVHELVRRAHAGQGPAVLAGKRVLQFSLQRRAAGLKQINQLGAEMQALVEALATIGEEIVPFFRDLHLMNQFSLESQIQALALKCANPMLGEGREGPIRAAFEEVPQLEQHFVLLHVEEPSLETARRILDAWSRAQQAEQHRLFTPQALNQALHLTHRFLARSRLPRKALDLLAQTGNVNPPGATIDASEVIERFCVAHKVNRTLVDPSVPLDLDALQARFRSQVLGQSEAVVAVVNMIGLIKAGLSDPGRPFGVFLFAGPTGVGKTHIAQLLAEYLFGGKDRLIRLNMADYPNEEDAELLFGNPKAFNYQAQRGMLSQRMSGFPFAVMLLDEFEKAHPKVHDRFLQLVDEGRFMNGLGETVSCRSMIIIATSNAGAEVFRGQAVGFVGQPEGKGLELEMDRHLQTHFRIEFLNRFDQLVHFYPLSRQDIRHIALRELDALKERPGVRQRDVRISVDDVVLDWLVVHGYDPEYGARFMRRTIERHVSTAMAETLVREQPPSGAVITVSLRHNRIVARVERGPAEARAAAALVTLPSRGDARPRTLTKDKLWKEAAEVLKRAKEPLAALDKKREEYSGLLERMNAPTFWKQPDMARPVLERFRELDVAIQSETRLAEPIRCLGDLATPGPGRTGDLSRIARGIEEATKALRDWEQRVEEQCPSAVWLLISNADPLHPAGGWIEALTDMELAWCRRLHLTASVVAYGLVQESLARVALEVEGPGTFSHLAMEAGLHRRWRRGHPDLRARIDIQPKGPLPDHEWRGLTDVRCARDVMNLEVTCRCRVELPDRGIVMEYLAGNREVLSHLASDLSALAHAVPERSAAIARIYGDESGGARDPRTGVSVSRLKEVLKGHLERFLEGWREHSATRSSFSGQEDNIGLA